MFVCLCVCVRACVLFACPCVCASVRRRQAARTAEVLQGLGSRVAALEAAAGGGGGGGESGGGGAREGEGEEDGGAPSRPAGSFRAGKLSRRGSLMAVKRGFIAQVCVCACVRARRSVWKSVTARERKAESGE